VREAGDRILGQLKRAFYARMEEVPQWPKCLLWL